MAAGEERGSAEAPRADGEKAGEDESREAFRRRRRAKNWVLLAALAAFAALVYVVAIVRMGVG